MLTCESKQTLTGLLMASCAQVLKFPQHKLPSVRKPYRSQACSRCQLGCRNTRAVTTSRQRPCVPACRGQGQVTYTWRAAKVREPLRSLARGCYYPACRSTRAVTSSRQRPRVTAGLAQGQDNYTWRAAMGLSYKERPLRKPPPPGDMTRQVITLCTSNLHRHQLWCRNESNGHAKIH